MGFLLHYNWWWCVHPYRIDKLVGSFLHVTNSIHLVIMCYFYENYHYISSNARLKTFRAEIMKVFLWVTWFLWKTKMTFVFERRGYQDSEIVSKAKEEAESWFMAHELNVLRGT